MLHRRLFLGGVLAAPAIIRTPGLLMRLGSRLLIPAPIPPMPKGNIKSIVDIMKERSIPFYLGEEYFSLAQPATWLIVRDKDGRAAGVEVTR